jgi:hypothetical protein
MSERSFSQWFWAVTGRSYGNYALRRRLEEAAGLLLASDDRRILEIALDLGYGSHEAFTRAFTGAFGISPSVFRKVRPGLRLEGKLNLIKEMYMGVLIKDLPAMEAVCFSAIGQNCERTAAVVRDEWMRNHPPAGKPRRVFGHNIDSEGKQENMPDNTGYKFYVSLDAGEAATLGSEGVPVESLPAGRFAVTGVEGPLDAPGSFIGEGWKRLSDMMAAKGMKAKEPVRWFEEELEPSAPGSSGWTSTWNWHSRADGGGQSGAQPYPMPYHNGRPREPSIQRSDRGTDDPPSFPGRRNPGKAGRGGRMPAPPSAGHDADQANQLLYAMPGRRWPAMPRS